MTSMVKPRPSYASPLLSTTDMNQPHQISDCQTTALMPCAWKAKMIRNRTGMAKVMA